MRSGQKWEKREERRGSIKNLKEYRISKVCTYAKRLLKPLTDFIRFDVDEFNDNLTGHFILDRIILVKISFR